MTTPDAPAPDTLSEDVADLRAIVHALAEQLQDNTKQLEALRETPQGEHEPEGDGDGEKADDGKHVAPPLILRLPADEYDAELVQLDAWVRYVLVPNYCNEITSNAPWCARWWEHPQAIARLHALWTAWQELTTPEAGGWTGPSVWHRDHLDPCMAALRSPSGPFAACMTTESPQHHVLPVLPVDPVSAPPGGP